MVIPDAPQDLMGDNAYDSDRLDTQLKFYGIELIAPHRRNRKNKTQDRRRYTNDVGKSKGSLLGCRTFAVSSSDMNRRAENFHFLWMLHLASSVILLRYL
jgi:hypothetical protein